MYGKTAIISAEAVIFDGLVLGMFNPAKYTLNGRNIVFTNGELRTTFSYVTLENEVFCLGFVTAGNGFVFEYHSPDYVTPKYDLTFDYNNATGGNSVNKLNIEFNTTIGELPTPTRTGYTFAGWSNEEIDTINKDTKFTWTHNVTVKAEWTANTYKMNFNYDEATGGNSTAYKTVTYDSVVGALPTPTKNNYDFGGWWTEEDGAGESVTAEYIWQFAEETTIYAKWNGQEKVLNFNYEGATENNTITTKAVIFNEHVGTLPIPIKTGNTFAGWYTQSGGAGTKFDENTVYTALGATTLYAKWETTLTFDYQGATGGNSQATTIVVYNANIGTLPSPSHSGLTFGGWYTQTCGDGTNITATTKYTYEAGITVYVKWNAIISFNYQGGTGTPASKTVVYNSAIGGLPTAEKTGNAFKGWWTETGGEDMEYTASTVYTQTTGITLYAKWETTLTFDYQGGTGTPASKTVVYNSAIASLPTPAKTGYAFGGWWTQASGAGIEYTASTVYTQAAGITLYAQWTGNSNSIIFDGNGNTGGSMINQTVASGETASLKANAYVKTGYSFAGWATTSGGAVVYTDCASYAMGTNSSYTLYAKWTANIYQATLIPSEEAYTVTFNLNGGAGTAPAAQNITATNGLTYPEMPTWSGYIFAGWYENFESTGIPYDFTATVTSSKILYAKWASPSSYTSIINMNASIGGISHNSTVKYYPFVSLLTQTVTVSTTNTIGDVIILLYDSVKTQLLSKDGGGSGANESFTYSVTAGTLYYIGVKCYSSSSGTCTLNLSGFAIPPASGNSLISSPVTYDANFTLFVPTRTGYTFSGWYDDIGGTGMQYTNASGASVKTWDKASNAMLYAKWNLGTYTISFDANGGSGAPSAVTATYNMAMPAITVTPTRTGYVFAGFFDETSGGIKYYNANLTSARIWDKGTATTLYAQWTGNNNSIIFDGNGNTGGSMANQTIASGEIAALTANAYVKTGYSFAGWAATSGGEVFYTDCAIFAMGTSSSYTLYAKWTANVYTPVLDLPYKIFFDLNGADGIAPATQNVSTTYGLTYPAIPTRNGYIFAGWYENPEGTEMSYDFTATVTSSKTLYAKWQQPTGHMGSISAGDSLMGIAFDSTVKYYAFVPLVSQQITIFSVKTSGDPYGFFYNSSKTQLTADDDSNGSYNFRIVYTVTAGTLYYIGIKGVGSSTTGSCALHITGTAIPPTSANPLILNPVTYDANFTLAVPTKTGYTFSGWYDGIGGTGTQYTNASGASVRTWDKAFNATLYAKWTANIYVITFDNQDAAGIESNIYVSYDSAVGTLPVPVKSGGNTFGGWFTQEGGKGTEYDENTVYRLASNLTLYAKWITTLTFDYDGATSGNSVADIEVVYKNTALPTLPRPYKDGYSFEGWYDGATEYTAGMIFAAAEMTTIKAKWVEGTDKSNFIYTSSGGNVTITGLSASGNNLTGIVIPSIIDKGTVAIIAANAFLNKSLTSAVVPESVTIINSSAFRGCPLTEITIPFIGMSMTATAYNSVFGAIFGYTTSNSAGTTEQYYYSYSYYYYYIPQTLKTVIVTRADGLKSNSFYNCSMLTTININSSITEIATYAFYNCSNLETITGLQNVNSIGAYAFSNCVKLTSINSIKPLTSVGEYAFNGCSLMNTVSFASTLTDIGGSAFRNCPLITTISLPSGLQTIGTYAFRGAGLTTLVIPDSVTDIGTFAFYGCPLTEITIPFIGTSMTATAYNSVFGAIFGYTTSNSAGTTEQYYYSYSYYYYYIPQTLKTVIVTRADGLKSNSFYNCSMLTTININSSITEIPTSAFYNCGIKEFVIPDSVTTIARGAFQGCAALESLTVPLLGTYDQNNHSYVKYLFGGTSYSASVSIPNLRYITITGNATSISNYAFYGLKSIYTVAININVQSIGISAFENCSALIILKLTQATPPSLENNCFAGINNFIVNVPSARLDAYLSNANYNTYMVTADNNAAIIFNSMGGSSVPMIITTVSSIVTPPANPVWDNRNFAGWYLDLACTIPFDFGVGLSRTVMLYAKWTLTPVTQDKTYPIIIAQPGEVFCFEFTPTTSGNYKIVISGGTTTVYAAFMSGSTVLNSSTGTNFQVISNNLVTGIPYTIQVKMYSSTVTGNFSFLITNA